MRDIRQVAIIGAGPSGLATAKYLMAEKRFAFRIFEQRDSVGGVWTHNSLTVLDDDFTIPRTAPSTTADKPIAVPGTDVAQFVSPVYDSLETNIPHTLMNFTDQPFPSGTSLFPPHRTVKQYLENYADDVRPFISLSTQVLRVENQTAVEGRDQGWEVETLDLKTRRIETTLFDAIVVASGHFNDPYIPDIPGLAQFNQAHTGSVSHSKFYKNPSALKDKKVIVVGNSASGIDLSTQISKVCQLPVIVSERAPSNTALPDDADNSWAEYKPEIAECVPSGRQVRFSNGEVESDVDHILFCTGYFYSFPFLRSLSPPVVTDGITAHHLYQHLLYIPDPTLAFIGIPQRTVPFPFAEAQAAWIARLWAGRLVNTPSQDEMMRDWERQSQEAHEQARALHILKFPKDLAYINMLYEQSMTAEKRAGLENDGKGKEPPYWGEEKGWTRERFPLIKLASRKLGDDRHAITTLEQLGFDYAAWKAENRVPVPGPPLLDDKPEEVLQAA